MQSLIDKTIAYFDPVRGRQRVAARMALSLMGGYYGASFGRPGAKARRFRSRYQPPFT